MVGGWRLDRVERRCHAFEMNGRIASIAEDNPILVVAETARVAHDKIIRTLHSLLQWYPVVNNEGVSAHILTHAPSHIFTHFDVAWRCRIMSHTCAIFFFLDPIEARCGQSACSLIRLRCRCLL